jgi:hypothetical protein
LVEKLREEKKIPPSTSSEAALLGTAAHALLEVVLIEMISHGVWDVSAEEYRGDAIEVSKKGNNTEYVPKELAKDRKFTGHVYTVDSDMIAAVNVAVSHVRQVLESLGASEKGIPEDITVDLEVDIDVSHLPHSEHLGGTADIRISQAFGELHIIDYKNGVGVPVSPEDNKQLRYYALGSDVMDGDMPSSVHLTIVQPRCPEVPPVQTYTTTPAAIREWANTELIPAVEAALSDNPTFKAGESQCHWCQANAHCPVTQDMALEVARADFASEVANLPDEKFMELFQQVSTIRAACTALEERALYELQTGKEIPGYKLVAGGTKRKWVKGAEEVLIEKKVPKKHMYNQKLVSFTQLEKIDKYKDLVASLVEKPEGKPTIAPDTDKRPALPSSVEQDFEPVD